MIEAVLSYSELLQPNDVDRALARTASQALPHLPGQGGAAHVDAMSDEDERKKSGVLPAAAVQLILDMLGQMAAGHAVVVVPIHAELTTQQAAEVLGVSRPFLMGLLKRGKLPFHKVGTHRRVRYGELLAYQRQEHEARRRMTDEPTRQGQEPGLRH